ncbi:DUF808 domain-containing protein [Propionibacteriaceae bacterium Y1923]|uniref:DUF808 domain-containing protein n=1 Tax=Aestuariimicrobium sp. Y1814 TaxID=3418742 RepID=UPI003C1A68C6
MAGGLAALLDDVAVIAKMTAVAGKKSVAVVVDDAAVTPQYVDGFSPKRELPIIWRITKGSLVNKAILVALLMLLDTLLPWVLTPLLMLGGLYLVYEGAEKVYELISGHGKHEDKTAVVDAGPEHEKVMVKSAITTDFILSAEILVISLNTINDSIDGELGIGLKLVTLLVVAIAITALVYGVVALIVKMDDIGLHMTKKPNTERFGRLLVNGMPTLLNVLSFVGMLAMLWVGGHILVSGLNTLGWSGPYDLAHLLADPAHHVPGIGGFLAWLVDTVYSALVGLLVGGLIVLVLHFLPFKRKDPHDPQLAEH